MQKEARDAGGLYLAINLYDMLIHVMVPFIVMFVLIGYGVWRGDLTTAAWVIAGTTMGILVEMAFVILYLYMLVRNTSE